MIELDTEFQKQKSKILEIVNKHLEKEHIDVSPTVLENLSIHLSLNVSRELNGTFISTSISQLKQLKKHELYPMCRKIVEEIADYYDIPLHRSEVFYTVLYISNTNLFDIDMNCEFDIYDDIADAVIEETIETIKDRLNIDLKENESFYKGITLHFFPAIERLQNNVQITNNPLLNDIKNEHDIEFQCAYILNEVVKKYYDKSFNEHELAYIALHFGTAFYNE